MPHFVGYVVKLGNVKTLKDMEVEYINFYSTHLILFIPVPWGYWSTINTTFVGVNHVDTYHA